MPRCSPGLLAKKKYRRKLRLYHKYREMEDGGYGPDPPKIKNEKPVDNFQIRWYTNRRKDLLT